MPLGPSIHPSTWNPHDSPSLDLQELGFQLAHALPLSFANAYLETAFARAAGDDKVSGRLGDELQMQALLRREQRLASWLLDLAALSHTALDVPPSLLAAGAAFVATGACLDHVAAPAPAVQGETPAQGGADSQADSATPVERAGGSFRTPAGGDSAAGGEGARAAAPGEVGVGNPGGSQAPSSAGVLSVSSRGASSLHPASLHFTPHVATAGGEEAPPTSELAGAEQGLEGLAHRSRLLAPEDLTEITGYSVAEVLPVARFLASLAADASSNLSLVRIPVLPIWRPPPPCAPQELLRC